MSSSTSQACKKEAACEASKKNAQLTGTTLIVKQIKWANETCGVEACMDLGTLGTQEALQGALEN